MEKRRDVPYQQMHRIGRIFNYLQSIKVKEGFSKLELMTKSCMINGFMNNTFCDKLSMEAATLSFIPQFCERGKRGYSGKLINRNFGQDVRTLVQEVQEINREMIEVVEAEEPNPGTVLHHSYRCKEIYLFQAYVELVMNLTVKKKAIVQDGILCEIKRNAECWENNVGDVYMYDEYKDIAKPYKRKGDGSYIAETEDGDILLKLIKCDIIKDTEGEWVPKQDFDKFLIDMIQYKVSLLKHNGTAIRSAITECVNRHSKKEGFNFEIIEDISHPNAGEGDKPAPYLELNGS